MKKIRHTTDQIVEKLRQADVSLGKHTSAASAAGVRFQIAFNPNAASFAIVPRWLEVMQRSMARLREMPYIIGLRRRVPISN